MSSVYVSDLFNQRKKILLRVSIDTPQTQKLIFMIMELYDFCLSGFWKQHKQHFFPREIIKFTSKVSE